MALDTLEIFGTEYTNVKGFKATDSGSIIKAYIRPQGTKSITENGSGIDVAEYATVDVAVSGGAPNLQTKSVSYTPTESAQSATVTADSGYDGLDAVSISVDAVSSSYVGTGVTRRSSSDLTATGATVSVPAGYYENSASMSISTGTEGTPVATKGAVSNHSISITPSVTNTAGYISGSTLTGAAVTVTADELITFSTIYTGSSDPDASTGVDGDIYLQTGS